MERVIGKPYIDAEILPFEVVKIDSDFEEVFGISCLSQVCQETFSKQVSANEMRDLLYCLYDVDYFNFNFKKISIPEREPIEVVKMSQEDYD